MAKEQVFLQKLTLDKELDKVTLREEALTHVLRPASAVGLGILFLALTMIFAGAAYSAQPAVLLIVAAAALAGYMAMNIGANDVTNNVGAAVGSKAMTLTTALIIAAIFEIAGAVFAGGSVVATIRSGIVDAAALPSGMALVWVMMAALLSSAVWINIATWSGAPISTTHAIVGGILGAGIGASGFSAVHWTSMAGIVASWSLSPILGGGCAALILLFIKTFIVYRDDKVAGAVFWTPVLIAVMMGCFATYFVLIGLRNLIDIGMPAGLLSGVAVAGLTWATIRRVIAAQARGLGNRNSSLRKLFRLPLILSAALLSFAHGANDVSNAIGPLSAIVATVEGGGPVAQVPWWVVLIGAFGISCGLLLFGPKLIRIVGQEITKLNPMRAFCVALSTAITVILATTLGLPVSTTHIAVGGVFGIGFFREWYTANSKRRLAYIRARTGQMAFEQRGQPDASEVRRRRLVRRSHFMTIVAAWIITVPAAALLSAGLYAVFSTLFL